MEEEEEEEIGETLWRLQWVAYIPPILRVAPAIKRHESFGSKGRLIFHDPGLAKIEPIQKCTRVVDSKWLSGIGQTPTLGRDPF